MLGLSHKTSGSGGGSLVKHGTVATNAEPKQHSLISHPLLRKSP